MASTRKSMDIVTESVSNSRTNSKKRKRNSFKRNVNTEKKRKSNKQRLFDNYIKNFDRILTTKLEKKGIDIEKCNIDPLLRALNKLESFPVYTKNGNVILFHSKSGRTHRMQEKDGITTCPCTAIHNGKACQENKNPCIHGLNIRNNQLANIVVNKISNTKRNIKKEVVKIDKELDKEVNNLTSKLKNTLSS